jgi:hypothetical protein
VALGDSEMMRFGIGFAAEAGSIGFTMAAIAATDISNPKFLDLNIKNLPQEFLREEAWAKKES